MVVTTEDNCILLLKMTFERGGYWQNVTGGAMEDESFYEAALREVTEETSVDSKNIIELKELDFLFEFKDQYQDDVVEQGFSLVAKNKWDVILDKNEHQEFKWKKISEITKEDFYFKSNYQAFLKATTK